MNVTGHKLPTGHIEGRRVWLNVQVFDPSSGVLEHLREANKTDTWGERLHTAWTKTSKGPPIPTASAELSITL